MNSDHIVKELHIKKRTIKAQLTRFKNFLNKDSTLDVVEIQCRLNKIKHLDNEFNIVQTQLELQNDGDTNDNETADFENEFFTATAAAEKLIQQTIQSDCSTPSSSNKHNGVNINLQTINMQTFNGSFNDWNTFRDSFKSSVENNKALTESQKFHYLKSSLRGDAAMVIKELDVTDANYRVAWQILENNFDNLPFNINNHIKALFEQAVIQRESPRHLRQLINNSLVHLRALEKLGQDIKTWDCIIIYIISTKLDPITNKEWEAAKVRKVVPTLNELTEFITKKCEMLLTLQPTKYPQKPHVNKSTTHVTSANPTCKFCNGVHPLHLCKSFLDLTPLNRANEIKKLHLCLNCFCSGHYSNNCKGTKCKKCSRNHNTLLHQDTMSKDPTLTTETNESTMPSTFSTVATNNCNTHELKSAQVILSTAIVFLRDDHGNVHECRALLDSASDINIITQKMQNRLNSALIPANMSISGINKSATTVQNRTVVQLKSKYTSYTTTLTCSILSHITERLPTTLVNVESINIPVGITLADKDYYKPADIHLLIGAELFWELLLIGRVKLGHRQPVLQKTHLGWVVAGPITSPNPPQTGNVFTCQEDKGLSDQVEKFWQLDECSPNEAKTPEQVNCEVHFSKTTLRNKDCRFVVRLPLKNHTTLLGNSKVTALKRLYATERKLEKDPQLKNEYNNFLQEYEDLGHMTEATKPKDDSYYLPHHAVVKESSVTTKVRIVFDGSCKTSTGLALNDILLVGPTIQQDLFSIVCRFRTHNYVITADIRKMYRQVLIHEDYRHLQSILWRKESNKPIKTYTLNTVTYGTASAPFHAVRCLHQLALDIESVDPTISSIIKNDFYVDDLLTGTDTLEKASKLCHNITKVLQPAGFNLHKWASNNKNVLQNITPDLQNSTMCSIDKNNIKTLGLQWNSQLDTLQYVTNHSKILKVTKRNILSATAKLFDPLGLLGPVIVLAKLMLQMMWQLNISWDETVPPEIYSLWLKYEKKLPWVNNILISRQVVCSDPNYIEMHGFSDASEKAYGACIYIRSTNSAGQIKTHLFCAKSRVAPTKRVTLPRLELCAAVLLAKLTSKIKASLSNVKVDEIHYWSDSTIVLAWIKTPSHKLKTFVGNRIAVIQNQSPSNKWHYVSTNENPADIISRGAYADQLLTSVLWWAGPSWMREPKSEWPTENIEHPTNIPESKVCNITTSEVQNIKFAKNLCQKYSSISKIQHMIAWCYRFKQNAANKSQRLKGNLSIQEIKNAQSKLIQLIQQEEFPREIQHLKSNKPISQKSKILTLNPFIDEHNIMRVGGRLANTNIKYNQKHQIILPSHHPFTNLLISQYHFMLLHAGTQSVLANIRSTYWPLAALNAIKGVLRKCITCFRINCKNKNQLMANIPETRVTPSRPFSVCGVDYAGPFKIKENTARRAKIGKAYLCIFVCFATKAAHCKLVSQLTTEAFIATFRRFTARRGRCAEIYSDNGTNFVGAKNEFQKFIVHETTQSALSDYLSTQQIRWHFIPARSPHFGGLWEATIKTAKRHCMKILKDAAVSFEELYTVFTQIEACLNSRPLTPISNDPSDLCPLTPGHFLIGDSLSAAPDEQLLNIGQNRLSRYQRMQQLVQHFWSRWSKEYLSLLQQRAKWHKTSKIEIGRLVVIKEDHLPPIVWRMGRIIKTHPGTDNVVRVVTIKTKNGELTRAINKVCVLPLE